uniref:lytic murein transglycosylase B n=1 Tax=Rhodoferax sp. GW822-FHT02A01 TaxID=3141537 RepID=UPI00406C7664
MKPFALLIAAVLCAATAAHAATAIQSLPYQRNHAGHAAPSKAKTKLKVKAKTASTNSKATGTPYASRPEVMQQADAIAARRGLDVNWVRHAIGEARLVPAITKAILPPPAGVPKNWQAYRSRFVEPVRIKAGTQFWLANIETLQRAEEQTGVPASIIVGILGVETIYGQHTGNFRVIDALCTLAFDFPAAHPKAEARTAFFLSELEEYLALTARTHTDPLALRGSYAGAMGWPQFMPSSWVKYAIDFDGDGRVDLFNSQADVIGSVANYFKAFNWQRGMPTHFGVSVDPALFDKEALMAPDIVPTFSVEQLAAKGVQVDEAARTYGGPLALIELQNGDAEPLYLAGTENFYTITRYNWSSYYAMAVIELGRAVADAMGSQTQMATTRESGVTK